MSEHLGLVTVLYNCEGVLQEFFDTLAIQMYKNFEIIIVDNMSKDNSLNECKRLAEKMPFKCYFIENKDNLGVAAGNNQGIKLALEHNCDKILLSNNDIILKEDTIQNLYNAHVANNADLSVPKIYYAGTNKIWCAGGWYDKRKGMANHYGLKQEDVGQFNEQKYITYSPTCFMLINSTVFSKVGFMDEKYFVYWDDTDFVYRCVFLNKQELLYVPSATLQHKVSYSAGEDSDFTAYQVYRNRIYFQRKFIKHSKLLYIENLAYHYVVRNLKLIRRRDRYRLVGKALKDGWNL